MGAIIYLPSVPLVKPKTNQLILSGSEPLQSITWVCKGSSVTAVSHASRAGSVDTHVMKWLHASVLWKGAELNFHWAAATQWDILSIAIVFVLEIVCRTHREANISVNTHASKIQTRLRMNRCKAHPHQTVCVHFKYKQRIKISMAFLTFNCFPFCLGKFYLADMFWIYFFLMLRLNSWFTI